MTLAQVLRAGAGLAVDDALLLESLAYGNLLVGAEHGRWLAERPRAAHVYLSPEASARPAGQAVRALCHEEQEC